MGHGHITPCPKAPTGCKHGGGKRLLVLVLLWCCIKSGCGRGWGWGSVVSRVIPPPSTPTPTPSSVIPTTPTPAPTSTLAHPCIQAKVQELLGLLLCVGG